MKIFRFCFAALFVVVLTAYLWVNAVGQDPAVVSGPSFQYPEGDLEISVTAGEDALRADLTASDAEDGDLTDQIILSGVSKLINGNTATVTFRVFDSDDNMATCVRTIHYTDYQSPRFEVTEALNYNSTYNIALIDRVHVSDCIDGDLTNSIRVSYLEGTENDQLYMVRVQVTNSMGDTAQVTLPVFVEEKNTARPMIRLTQYLLYLKQGDEFDPDAQVKSVTLPNGTAVRVPVHTNGAVDTAKPGTYHVEYTCAYNGLSSTTYLTIVVE